MSLKKCWIGRIFITWKNSQIHKRKKTKKRNNFNYVQLHKINKLSSYTTIYIQRCLKKEEKKYTVESVPTSHSESCTAYLLIDERTGPIGTM